MTPRRRDSRAIVIGTSAGGLKALSTLLPSLPASYPWPIVVVQHLHPRQASAPAATLDRVAALTVKEGEDKEPVEPGYVYLAPPDYHLLVERGGTLALSVDPKVNYARPSIDVLFESAAHAWAPALVAVVLTGANRDGAAGSRLIHDRGGLTLAQDPQDADHPEMPRAAIDAGGIDRVLALDEIGPALAALAPPRGADGKEGSTAAGGADES